MDLSVVYTINVRLSGLFDNGHFYYVLTLALLCLTGAKLLVDLNGYNGVYFYLAF
jgi:hypothetical protein